MCRSSFVSISDPRIPLDAEVRQDAAAAIVYACVQLFALCDRHRPVFAIGHRACPCRSGKTVQRQCPEATTRRSSPQPRCWLQPEDRRLELGSNRERQAPSQRRRREGPRSSRTTPARGPPDALQAWRRRKEHARFAACVRAGASCFACIISSLPVPSVR